VPERDPEVETEFEGRDGGPGEMDDGGTAGSAQQQKQKQKAASAAAASKAKRKSSSAQGKPKGGKVCRGHALARAPARSAAAQSVLLSCSSAEALL